jgi:gamma-glutamyltranspeptidase/glutathione hydrolase
MKYKKAFFIVLFLSLTVILTIHPAPAQTAIKSAEVKAASGMVASAHSLASQAGIEILKGGGNAVDAAVAAAFAVGVAEPNASGIGGEGIMVIYLAGTGTAVAVDYRSSSPASAMFPKGFPSTGCAAVAVPGTVAGLTLALEKYGTMNLSRVLAPSIKIADEGFKISATLATIIRDNYDEILKNRPLAKIFCPEELPLEAGDVLKNPDLAESLRKIAAGGRDVFYRGELADKIAAEIKEGGGFMTKDDLGAYRAVERRPVRGAYRGYDLISAPPPEGGIAVVETLQILENFELGRWIRSGRSGST